VLLVTRPTLWVWNKLDPFEQTVASILTWLRRFINHLLTYLLTYLLNSSAGGEPWQLRVRLRRSSRWYWLQFSAARQVLRIQDSGRHSLQQQSALCQIRVRRVCAERGLRRYVRWRQEIRCVDPHKIPCEIVITQCEVGTFCHNFTHNNAIQRHVERSVP